MNLKRGFTLVELLLVIFIISMLAALLLTSLQNARIKARDAKRAATLQEMQKAIELYNTEHGHYPNTSNAWTAFDNTNIYYNNPLSNPATPNITTALQPYLHQTNFVDPSGPAASTNAGYIYNSNGTDYLLMSWVNPENMSNYPPSYINAVRCGTVTNGQCSITNSAGFWSPGGAGF